MSVLTLVEAQNRLPELLTAARQGQSIDIVDEGWTYRLSAVPRASRRPRPPVTGMPSGGQLEGLLVVPEDFDDPLDELNEYMP